MKIRTTWKDAESRKIQRRTLSAIESRVRDSRRPATAKALRDTLEAAVHPDTLRFACDLKGIPSRMCKDADALFDVLYGLHWIQQFPADQHVSRLREYFATPWGVDSCTDLFDVAAQ